MSLVSKLSNSKGFLSRFNIILFTGLFILLIVKLHSITVWITVLTIAVLRVLQRRGQVHQETLSVVRELGVQLETKYFSGKATHVFIEKKKIKSIIINEGVKSYGIIFYMAFIVEGKDKMVLAFQNLIPKLSVLLPIYRGTRAVILEYSKGECFENSFSKQQKNVTYKFSNFVQQLNVVLTIPNLS